jgi:MFS family permease
LPRSGDTEKPSDAEKHTEGHLMSTLGSTIESVKTVCTRGLVLAPVAALLLSVAFLLLGNGLLGTLLVLRAGHEGFSSEIIGLMMSAYFAGYTVGALYLPRVIVSVGHVRTFAGFAAIASMTALLHLAWVEPWAWISLRVLTGLAYAGMILATESWLNAHAVPSTRGQLLSVFGVVSTVAWASGQALLNLAPTDGIVLFLIVSLLISAAVVPVTLLPGRPPAEVEQEAVPFRQLLSVSPLATAGVFLAGLAIGGFWGMGPNFAERIGLGVGGISAFMAAVFAGTLVLQWPLGWLSDKLPRNLIIAAAALGSAAAAIGIALAAQAPLPVLLIAAALFGGFGIPIYSLCVASANDNLSPTRLLGTARGLLLLNGLGTTLGPFAGGLAMNLAGPGGLFLYAALLLAVLAVVAAPLPRVGHSRNAPSTRCPHTPMITVSLNTLLQQPEAGSKQEASRRA